MEKELFSRRMLNTRVKYLSRHFIRMRERERENVKNSEGHRHRRIDSAKVVLAFLVLRDRRNRLYVSDGYDLRFGPGRFRAEIIATWKNASCPTYKESPLHEISRSRAGVDTGRDNKIRLIWIYSRNFRLFGRSQQQQQLQLLRLFFRVHFLGSFFARFAREQRSFQRLATAEKIIRDELGIEVYQRCI